MILHYFNKEKKFPVDNYPNVVACMMVNYDEFMISFIDALGCLNTRRLKVNENYYFMIEEE